MSATLSAPAPTTSPDPHRFDGDMLDLLPVGALVVDRDLVVQLWNSSLVEWSGMRSEDVVGRVLTDLFETVSEPRYRNRLMQVFETGLPATFSASFHNHFLPLPARHGLDCGKMIQQTDIRRLPHSRSHAMITIQDVSYQYVQLTRLKAERADLVRTRDALTQSNHQLQFRNQELDEFNYVASHDLQEPLRKISTFTQLLAEELPPSQLDEDCKLYLGYIQNATSRMRALIRDLLSLSKTSTNQLHTNRIDLEELVKLVLGDLEIRIQETSATIHCDPLPTIDGDARMMSQLFQNLIGNALKFIGDASPRIHVTAERGHREWIFGVRDNGIGIQPEFAEKVFKPFQRLHAAQEYQGTGIGLAICRKAVSRHGGRIWVDSVPDQGCHFRFSIPETA